MADIFYTILIAWVLWKIFGGVSSSRVHVFHHNAKPKKEGDAKITSDKNTRNKKSSDDVGEYVDYEEVK
jgi:hypothetical protein